MTSRDFCYWLQGFFEIEAQDGNATPIELTSRQVDMIRRHLALVFKHEIDPSMGSPEHQAKLNAIHNAQTEETLKKLAEEVEELKKRPPQKVIHSDGGSPFGPVMRC